MSETRYLAGTVMLVPLLCELVGLSARTLSLLSIRDAKIQLPH